MTGNMENEKRGKRRSTDDTIRRNGNSWIIRKKNMWRNHPFSVFVSLLVWGAALLVIALLVFLTGFIAVKGVRHLSPELFALTYTTDNVSLMPALLNTLIITVIALLIAVPTGIFAAVYLVEYAKKGSRIVRLIRVTTETLQGIPSILYGLFGLLFFSTALGWGYSLLAGAMTLVIMILPLVIRTTEEALLGVPDAYREASFGLGAGKLRTIFCVVLPSAIPGILSGVILATGRIVGETAALLYPAGTVANIGKGKLLNLFRSGRSLAVHMYVLSTEGLYMEQAYATAVVLLVLVLALNAFSSFCARRLMKRQGQK